MKIAGEARWPAFVADAHLVRQCGAATVARGRAYEQQRRVSDLQTDTRGGYAAVVRGSGERSYDVELSGHLDPARGRVEPMWRSRCSCPLQGDCKHTVATLLAIRVALLGRSEKRAVPPPPPAWESALGPLLAAAGSEDASALALRLTLVQRQPTAWAPGGLLLPVAPARMGSRGRWIKTGATWRDLASPQHRLNEEQRRLAHEFHRLLQAARFGADHYVYYDATGNIDLVAAPSSIWPLLGRAVDAGVSLIDGDDRPVVLGVEALSVGVGIERDEQGLGVRARLLRPDGTDVGAHAAHLVPLGSPMHGVALVDEEGMSLHAVPQSPPEALAALLREARTLSVPRSDEARFTATYLPALRAASRVDAGPGYELPQVHPPRLRLLVRFDGEHRAQVDWRFAYRVDDDTRLVPLDGARADATRDHRAEQRTLHRVLSLPELAAHPRLTDGPGVLGEVRLEGMETARFSQEVLGALQEHEDVDVEIVGEVLEYGEALDVPVVQLNVADRADDNDWFDLSMGVTVDGQAVPLGALIRALSRQETHLLLPSGIYFRLDVPALDRLRLLLEEARALLDPDGEPGTMRVTFYQAGLWEQLAALGVVASQSRRWAQAVGRLLAATDRADADADVHVDADADVGTDVAAGPTQIDATPAPLLLPGLQATLRPYQAEGFGWLSTLWDAGLGGVLADDMGLGKTIQTLALLTRAKQRGDLTDPVLVVAPTSVIGTWVGEAARFAPGLTVVPVTETQRRRGGTLDEVTAGADVVVTSYTLLRIGAAEHREKAWSGVILDEAQFVKNHRAKTYAAVRRLERPFTLAITGTPLENSLMDLWAILSLTCPGLFPDPEAFARDYRRPIEGGNDTARLAALRRHIRPFVLRRTKDHVAADLPPKTEQVVSIPMAPAHRRAYERHLHRERQRLLGLLDDLARNRVGILAALTKLRQLALDPGLVDEEAGGGICPAKVEALIEQLTELAREGHRALVFSQFTRFLTSVQARLEAAGIDVVYLDGSTRDRSARIEEFRGGSATAFLISLKAGGFGLTLTEADYVFVLDPWWNPAAENQAIDRAHRIGQAKPVMVYRYVSAGTIEEKVHALQQRKQGLFDRVVDDDASLATALGADDIRELLAG